MNQFEVTFLGTNGSCAYNNGNRGKYGSNTLSIAVSAGGETLVFDSGTGVCGLRGLPDYQREHIHMFFTHYHLDHISGLLFGSHLFDPQKRFDIYGGDHNGAGVRDVLAGFLSVPVAPVGMEAFRAKIHFNTVSPGEDILLPGGVSVRTYGISHPNDTVCYRVEYGGKSFCYCTDVELRNHQDDGGLFAFTRGVDLLVLDSFFDDGQVIPGWGHSSWRECAEWAARANVKKLALYHYSYNFDDADIDAMEAESKKIFPGAFASADRMRVRL